VTTRELRDICQKGSSEPFLISKYLYRPFTIYATRLYIAAGASSNTATAHSLLAGLAAALCGLGNSPLALLLTALFIQAYFVLDHVDGELARYNIFCGTQKPSLAGEFFDLWTHLHTYNLTVATIGIALYRETGNLTWPVLGLLGCNICGSYQRMALSSVLIGALARGRLKQNDPRYAGLLSVSHGGDDQSSPTNPSTTRRLATLAAELIIFPGNILGITIACAGDALLHWTPFPPIIFRCAWLVGFVTVGLASKAYRTRATIRQLQAAGAAAATDHAKRERPGPQL